MTSPSTPLPDVIPSGRFYGSNWRAAWDPLCQCPACRLRRELEWVAPGAAESPPREEAVEQSSPRGSGEAVVSPDTSTGGDSDLVFNLSASMAAAGISDPDLYPLPAEIPDEDDHIHS